jgi:glutamate synthase (ferredoxin)
MSGGIAYVYDPKGILAVSGNREMVHYTSLEEAEDLAFVKAMIETHILHTDSPRARLILSNWDQAKQAFIRVMPYDYQRVLETVKQFEAQGMTGEEALMAAFKANNADQTRASGN